MLLLAFNALKPIRNHTDIIMTKEFIKIGLVSTSDRAASGIYADQGIPSLQEWLNKAVMTPIEYHTRLVADEQDEIKDTLTDLVDYQGCHLILTTGGTGPAVRDVTPEATLAAGERLMPGFEIGRAHV